MIGASIAKIAYRDRLHAMIRTRRYKISMWTISTTIAAWCAVNAAMIVAGVSSGTTRQPETMTKVAFLIASIAYWLSLPLAVGALAMLVLHLVIPYVTTTSRRENEDFVKASHGG